MNHSPSPVSPLPFTPISRFYQQRFGSKVYKIPLAIAEDCPNRAGLKGMKPCVFCDEWGSAARSEAFALDLDTQIQQFREVIRRRFKADQFLAYFQAYTNTFLRLKALQAHIDTALAYPEIKGIVLGTRPDCISQGVLNLWNEYSQKTYVGVELGVQTFNNDQLKFLERGHSGEDSIQAIQKIAKETSVHLGIHLIFGLPGETIADVIQTARLCNSLPIQNVKLHHLHVLKNTPLEGIYREGKFQPLEFFEYADRVAAFLDHLSPAIAVHRLAAYSSRWEELVAPAWTADKMRTHQELIDRMKAGGHHQGRLFKNV